MPSRPVPSRRKKKDTNPSCRGEKKTPSRPVVKRFIYRPVPKKTSSYFTVPCRRKNSHPPSGPVQPTSRRGKLCKSASCFCSRPCAFLCLSAAKRYVYVVTFNGFEEKNEKKNGKKRNPAAPKTHHEVHSSPATATTSRRRSKQHVPRGSPYSPASIVVPGFVEIGLVQLSQSVTNTNVTHTEYSDRQANAF